LLRGDHSEERGLAGAVRTDDADDAAARQREGQIIHQQIVAVRLPNAASLDDEIAKTRTGRDVDFGGLDALCRVFAKELFVCIEPRFPFRLPRARRHPDPLELAFERPLALGFSLLLERQSLLLLVKPRRVVALPRDPAASVELQNPSSHVVE